MTKNDDATKTETTQVELSVARCHTCPTKGIPESQQPGDVISVSPVEAGNLIADHAAQYVSGAQPVAPKTPRNPVPVQNVSPGLKVSKRETKLQAEVDRLSAENQSLRAVLDSREADNQSMAETMMARDQVAGILSNLAHPQLVQLCGKLELDRDGEPDVLVARIVAHQPAPESDPPAAEKLDDQQPVELAKMKKAELAQLCEQMGIESTGTRATMIERIEAYAEENAAEENAADAQTDQ